MKTPIWARDGCNADDVITKLINKGMDLTQRTSFFNKTVLHYWAGGINFCNFAKDHSISYQEGSLSVVKLLVNKGANLLALDNWGFTPLIEAASGPHRGLPNLKVFDFLLERDEYSRAEKIEALELVGAVILQYRKNASLFPKAFDYWRKALELRQMNSEGSSFIEKPRLNLKNVHITERNTSAELEDVISHPDKFVMQSYLVRLRILSSKSWDAIDFVISSDLLDYCFRELQHHYKSVEIFYIIWAMLATLLSRLDLRENKDAQKMIDRIVEKLTGVFLRLSKNCSEIWIKEMIKSSLDLIASATEYYELVTCNLIRIVRNLSHLPRRLLNTDAIEPLSKVRDKHGRNLLHEAIRVASSHANIYAITRLLLYAGCDPNAKDTNGNTPLHFLIQIDERYCVSDLNLIAVLLLDFGAQLSQKNADGKTAVDLLIRKNQRNRNEDPEQGFIRYRWDPVADWCSELPRLTCLSARLIRGNRIPYLRLPANLIPMIEKHKNIEP